MKLDVHDLQKNYGSFAALSGVSFSVAAGELFGLLGPNGAGKTTLLSILACLSNADSGTATFGGETLSRGNLDVRRQIGIATQDLSLYLDLSARENLKFFGELYGMSGSDLQLRIGQSLDFAGLADKAKAAVRTFSGGMKRRLNLAVAALHRPSILLLDEPTTGVDPQSRNHIFDCVRELNRGGTTVIYTSHYMEEVQALCSRIGILDNGKLIACDTLPNLLHLLPGSIRLVFADDPAPLIERLQTKTGLRIERENGRTLAIACADASVVMTTLVNELRGSSCTLVSMQATEPNLERVFLHLTERTLRD